MSDGTSGERAREDGGGAAPGGRRALLLVLAAWAGVPGGAAAQAGGQPGDTLRADTARVLSHEGITVRALRAPISADALPFSLTIRRPSALPPSGGLTLGDALRAVPGLQVHSRYNDALGDRIVVRGFGARAQFGVRGVQVVVDGVPATMPDGQTTLNHLDFGALDRVEVLRGPAAAAHGNAAGGVLFLATTPPPSTGLRQELAAVTGSDGLVRMRGVTGGSNGAVGWVGTVSREWRDGYRPHSGTDRWQGTGRFDAPLGAGFVRVVAHGVAYDADNPGSLTPAQFEEAPHQAQAFNVNQRTGEDGRHGQVGVVWERPLAGASIEAAAYGLARALENPIPPSIIDLDRLAGGARVLVRGQAGVRGLRWAAGLDGALQADDRRNYENADGERGALTLDQAERVSNVAVHGQALVPLIDRLDLFVAARYDRVAFSAADRLVTTDNPDDSGDRVMDAVSPTAGLRLAVSRDVSLFANVATAFETPTTTELVNRPDGAGGFNEALEPQRTVSWEVGGRAALMPGVGLEASAYHARIDDALVPFEVASAPGRQYFRNAGEAVHRGVELVGELRTAPVDVLLAYARTDAEFASFTTEAGTFDGMAVPGVRPWTVEASVVVRPVPRLALEAAYEAAGAMPVDDANTAEFEAPRYHLFGLRAAGTALRVGGWTARPYAGVDNLFDRTWVASVVPNAFGDRFFEPGPGRSFYVGVDVGVASREDPPR